MRSTLLLFWLLPALLASPAYATKPTPPLDGLVTLSSDAPRIGETAQIRFTFSAAAALTDFGFGYGQNTKTPKGRARCPFRWQSRETTLPLVVPSKSYVIETSVKFEGARAACDIFIEPLAQFSGQEASLGMIFRQTISLR